jgi:integrase
VPNILTDFSIKCLVPPSAGTVTVWDGALKGFGMRVSQGGAKTFVVLIASGRRQAIGRWPTLTLAKARIEARRLLAQKTLGKIRPVHTAFDDAKAEFLEACGRKNRSRTVEDYRRLLSRHFPYERSSVGSITGRDILRRLGKLAGTPSEQHHAFTAARAFFRWCVRQDIIERSPMENMEVPRNGTSRDRVLSDDELAAIYRTALNGSSPLHRIIALLILTGQRRGEIAHLERNWIDRKERIITFPARIIKNRHVHVIPLGDAAASILETIPQQITSPYVFPAARTTAKGKQTTVYNGWGKQKIAFDRELANQGYEVAPWRIHDLRRTVASGMAALHVPQTVVEKLLNHLSGGTLSPIAQVYNRHTYLSEMRQAVGEWAAKLASFTAAQGTEPADPPAGNLSR